MKLKNYQIKTYVSKDLYQRIDQEATSRNTKMSQIVRHSITEYFLLREEMANAVESPGSLGDNHNGKIIHTLLARTEERFDLAIKKLEDKLAESQEKIQFLTSMINHFYYDLMRHIPKIPPTMEAEANVMAKMRHNNWLASIKNDHEENN